MKSILTKLTMGLICTSLAASPAGAAIERKMKPVTESTTAPASAPQSIADAAKSYKAMKLTRTEKRDARKAVKSMLRDAVDNKLLLVLIAILLPPLAVFLHEGSFNTKVLISILLWLLFYFPGLIYALIVILGKD